MMQAAGSWGTNRAWIPMLLTVALYCVTAVTFACVAAIAIVHVDDRFDVGAASGAMMALAAAARAGVWYPPVFQHGFYGGTRYMPLPILIERVGAAAGGGYLTSAKLIVYAANVALYTLVYLAARRRGAPRPIAAVLVAAVLSSTAGATTSFAIRWDSLATALQLGALVLMSSARSRKSEFAGGLSALAIAVKFTALWGPAAIVTWLLLRRRWSELGRFCAALVLGVAALAAASEALSHGRMAQQIAEFAFAGSTSSSALEGVHRINQLVIRNESELPLMLALALLSLIVAAARRRLGLYELGLIYLIPILFVVMRDQGAYENHLIDLEVLGALVIAGAFRFELARRAALVRVVAITACLLLATGNALRYTLVPDARSAVSDAIHGRVDPRYATHPYPQLTSARSCTLFEDATIPVLSGRRPIVLDAFIVHRLQTKNRAALTHLIARIDAREFHALVLDDRLTDLGWFSTLDFGTALASAMERNYRLATASLGGYFVYLPRGDGSQRPCGQPLTTWG